jgi:hypothetical protein
MFIGRLIGRAFGHGCIGYTQTIEAGLFQTDRKVCVVSKPISSTAQKHAHYLESVRD